MNLLLSNSQFTLLFWVSDIARLPRLLIGNLPFLNSLENHPNSFTVKNDTIGSFDDFQAALVDLYTSTQTADLVSGRVAALTQYNLYDSTADYTLTATVAGGSGTGTYNAHRLVLAVTVEPIHWIELGVRPYDGGAWYWGDAFSVDISDSDLSNLVSTAYDGSQASSSWIRSDNTIVTPPTLDESYASYVPEDFDNTRGVATAAIVVGSTALAFGMMSTAYLRYKQKKLEDEVHGKK